MKRKEVFGGANHFRSGRLFILLRREGERSEINRLYPEEGLTARKCRARRRVVGTRRPRALVIGPRTRLVPPRAALLHPQRGERRDPRVPGCNPGHLGPGPAGRARTDDDHRTMRQARDGRLPTVSSRAMRC